MVEVFVMVLLWDTFLLIFNSVTFVHKSSIFRHVCRTLNKRTENIFILQWGDTTYCSPKEGGLTDDDELRFECIQGDNGTYTPISGQGSFTRIFKKLKEILP